MVCEANTRTVMYNVRVRADAVDVILNNLLKPLMNGQKFDSLHGVSRILVDSIENASVIVSYSPNRYERKTTSSKTPTMLLLAAVR